jgi:hypothetical protein
MAGVLDQSQTGQSFFFGCFNGSPQEYVGQGVQAGLPGVVSQVDFYLRKVGSPTGNANIEIWSRDGGGLPSAKVSGTATLDVSTVGTSFGWVSVNIVGSPEYAVNDVFCPIIYYSSGDGSNKIDVGYDNASYANGILSYDTDGASWTGAASYDLTFRTYMAPAGSSATNLTLLGVG